MKHIGSISSSACLVILLTVGVVWAWALGFEPRQFLERRNTFVTLDSPQCIRASEEKRLEDEHKILGVVRNGESCAYPLEMMAAHRVVNDHLGGPEIVITFCPESSTGGAFDPQLEGKALQFDVVGHYQGVTVISDRQMKSLWSVLTGEALTGPRQGKRLQRIPTLITSWKKWKELHPDSWVLAFDSPQSKPYDAKNVFGNPDLPVEIQQPPLKSDKQMPNHMSVLGVVCGKEVKAYPIEVLKQSGGVLSDEVGKEHIVIFHDFMSGGAMAFHLSLNDRLLSFTAKKKESQVVFIDKETGSTWTLEGKAIDGLLKGLSLTPIDYVQTEWYAWTAAYPNTAVYEIKPPKRK